MAEEEQHFHEEEQYEEEGMEADGAGEEGHEDAVDLGGRPPLALSYASRLEKETKEKKEKENKMIKRKCRVCIGAGGHETETQGAGGGSSKAPQHTARRRCRGSRRGGSRRRWQQRRGRLAFSLCEQRGLGSHTRGAAAALCHLRHSEQSHHPDRQVWKPQGLCIHRVPRG